MVGPFVEACEHCFGALCGTDTLEDAGPVYLVIVEIRPVGLV